MSRIVRWEEPPVKRAAKWVVVADQLKEHSPDWALVAEGVDIKYGYDSAAKSLRRLGCEVTTRAVDGQVSVWARWVDV